MSYWDGSISNVTLLNYALCPLLTFIAMHCRKMMMKRWTMNCCCTLSPRRSTQVICNIQWQMTRFPYTIVQCIEKHEECEDDRADRARKCCSTTENRWSHKKVYSCRFICWNLHLVSRATLARVGSHCTQSGVRMNSNIQIQESENSLTSINICPGRCMWKSAEKNWRRMNESRCDMRLKRWINGTNGTNGKWVPRKHIHEANLTELKSATRNATVRVILCVQLDFPLRNPSNVPCPHFLLTCGAWMWRWNKKSTGYRMTKSSV